MISHYDEFKIQGYEELVAALLGFGGYSKTPLNLDIDLKNRESPPTNPSKEDQSNIELKVVPPSPMLSWRQIIPYQ